MPNTPACELFFASNAAELKGLRVLNRELRAENIKLRKLARDMWEYDYARHWSTLNSDMEHRESVWQQMCELGIEVDA